MEKRKWPWNRKSSERSPGEGESNGSISSHSERYSSDEQEALRESPNDASQSPEVTSKATTTLTDEQMEGTIKALTEKLSAALVNVSAKEELVKQHAKVAEEAVAGWEKAENEVAALKQQLEVAMQQNLNLEVRSSHLEGALRECVKQLRQARDEATVEKNSEWETQKAELEKQIADLRAESENSTAIDPDILLVVEALEKENASLRQELESRCKVFEVIVSERDLSTRAAETASKLQLESIKKVAKLEAECRRLQSMVRKSSPVSNQKSVVTTPFNAESSCSDSLATSNIATGYSVEIDMMDDFLEMERLAGLSDTKIDSFCESESSSRECTPDDNVNAFKAELESATQQVAELEKKIGKLEEEKLGLQNALDESVDSLMAAQRRVAETETRLEELQKELTAVNETKELLEFQLVSMEAEARTMSSNIDSLKAEIEDDRKLSTELSAKCQEMEKELTTTVRESEQKKSNSEPKIKQEDLAVAADKLAECQKTIASLGRQLQSLATLEDFLIETPEIGGVNCNEMIRKYDVGRLRMSLESYNQTGNRKGELAPLSNNQLSSGKSWSSFGRMFSPSKSVVEVENGPG